MMLRIGNRVSHDVDIFLPDPQFLSFLDPEKRDFEFEIRPDDHRGDGTRFLKLAFQGIGEIDFIVAGALTPNPSTSELVHGEEVQLETVPEIIAKKIYHRGSTIKPRDIFDIASAGVLQSGEVINALKPYRIQVNEAISRMEKLNPEFVARAIAEMTIKEAYAAVATTAMARATELLHAV